LEKPESTDRNRKRRRRRRRRIVGKRREETEEFATAGMFAIGKKAMISGKRKKKKRGKRKVKKQKQQQQQQKNQSANFWRFQVWTKTGTVSVGSTRAREAFASLQAVPDERISAWPINGSCHSQLRR
jgi:hypothetical protein